MPKPLSATNDGYGLLIGDDPETGQPRYYVEEGSLVTIAAPGTGKTQCHMIPNLLTYKGPAIVLDVKRTLWNETSDWRSSRYGPVYRIDLDHPEESDHFNPFTFISSDHDHLWKDAETVANLLHTQQAGSDGGQFFDNASLAYMTALAAYIRLEEKPHRQNPETLSEYVSGLSLDDFLAKADKVKQLPALRRAVALIKGSDPRTRGNVTWTAQNSLRAWDDPIVTRLSRVSDWSPEKIRADNGTVYICLSTETLELRPAYARMVIGQHIRALLRQKVDRTVPIVQFFIDEAPQLRRMDIIPEAIATGREYNLRLWLIGQWTGQFVTAFGKETAEGMIGACGLQAYMSPSLQHGAAEAVSQAIGTYEHRFDSTTRRPRVSAQRLAGPEFADCVITFDHNQYVKLRKHPFYADENLKRMAGASP